MVGAPGVAGDALGELVDRLRGHRGRARRRGAPRRGAAGAGTGAEIVNGGRGPGLAGEGSGEGKEIGRASCRERVSDQV